MTDELDLDLNLDDNINNNNRDNNRFTKLTEKVGEEAKARAEAEKAKAEAETRAQTAEKERDFYSSFSDSAGKYPEATEFKDAIKEKVMSGYSVEDATVSILAKEGRLQNYTPPAPRQESPAGGSATNQIRNDTNKSLNEMSREEKRAELLKSESESGGISQALRKTY